MANIFKTLDGGHLDRKLFQSKVSGTAEGRSDDAAGKAGPPRRRGFFWRRKGAAERREDGRGDTRS